mmetsp:Transcript_13005/g.29602  ORF Transcript_13005/g.29602 Transcript_13005/m.29602 type:complete len:228 (+) Transcript_13005:99-782(+)
MRRQRTYRPCAARDAAQRRHISHMGAWSTSLYLGGRGLPVLPGGRRVTPAASLRGHEHPLLISLWRHGVVGLGNLVLFLAYVLWVDAIRPICCGPGRRRTCIYWPSCLSCTRVTRRLGDRWVLEVVDALDAVVLLFPPPLATSAEDNPVHAVRQCPDALVESPGLVVRRLVRAALLALLFPLQLLPLVHDILVGGEVLRLEEGVQKNKLHVQQEQRSVDGGHCDEQP